MIESCCCRLNWLSDCFWQTSKNLFACLFDRHLSAKLLIETFEAETAFYPNLWHLSGS